MTAGWSRWRNGLAAIVVLAASAAGQAAAEPMHGIAMHGAPALPADFAHLPYADPKAPQGGRVNFAAIGTFDSLNPLIVKGRSAAAVRDYVFESLLDRNFDEPFSLYGLIAETVETPPDRGWVAFRLRPQARFSDGAPVTVEDVVFSFETLRTKGRPNHRSYYAKVERIEQPEPGVVKFVFGPDGDREMPLIIGLMPIVPKHVYSTRDFDETSLVPPIGSGPYVIAEVDPGSSVLYRRNPDYWGRDLPINRGRYNFDEVRYEYYRDEAARFEAFKKGLYDFLEDWDPARWATGYDFPAAADGRVVKEEFVRQTPTGMLALAFNTRRPVFADKRVRQALTLLFDFQWLNANLYHGLYRRTESFYQGSELSALDRPASEAERTLLAPYMDAVEPSVLDGTYHLAESNGTGRDRAQLREAIALLGQAGYELRGASLVNAATGEPLTFEIMVAERRQERYALAYAKALERAGVKASVRQVDSVQYQQRRQTYDFDMVEHFWYASLSPGNEQEFYWSRASADTEGTRNYMGAKQPGIDAMIAALLAAEEREDFVTAVRALDRLLMSGSYVIPLFHAPAQWTARWARLGHPERQGLDGYKLDTWYIVEDQR